MHWTLNRFLECWTAGASISLSMFPISTKFKNFPPFPQNFINFIPIIVQFTFLGCFMFSPLFWPWCIYASCLTRTGRPLLNRFLKYWTPSNPEPIPLRNQRKIKHSGKRCQRWNQLSKTPIFCCSKSTTTFIQAHINNVNRTVSISCDRPSASHKHILSKPSS